jgi:transcriptional regulator with XRE-family HTH domain
MAFDPVFGERLRAAIVAAGYKSMRKFTLERLHWDAGSGPQRLQNYLNGRIPDVETIGQLADATGSSVAFLLGLPASGADDPELRDILVHLLALADIPADTADTIASAALEGRRLLRAFPEEEPLATRAKFAARAAWHQRRSQAHDRSRDRGFPS